MKDLGENIWVHEDAMSLAGSKLRLRMTIVKLLSGNLWVHSPTALSSELKKEIEALGSVKFIVGPNNGHNIWLSEWQDAFPDAALFVTPGIPKKVEIKNYQIIDEGHENIWEADFEHARMPGVPFFEESVFLHKSTKSLIVADLIQNHSDKRPAGFAGFMTRFVFEPIGFKGMCVAPPLKMDFMHKDKANFCLFIKKIKTWDFDRIVVTHGDIIDADAKQVFASLCERFIR